MHQRFNFKAKTKSKGSRDLQNSSLFERSACFYVTTNGNFEVFNTLALKQIFRKTKTFFTKMVHRFFVESANIENATFSYKHALPKAKVNTDSMSSAKWNHHKNELLPVATLLFSKSFFSIKISYKELIQRAKYPNVCYIHTFRKCLSFI